jgi:phage shock protein A
MECAELAKLRGQVREIRKEMSARRERARYMAEQSDLAFSKDEYRDLLERKLVRTVADIEQHVARHQCQE